MTRKQCQRAIKLAEKLVDGLSTATSNRRSTGPDRVELEVLLGISMRLREMLVPPPTMEEVLLMVPGETVTARAKTVGISRQGYYNLINGMARADASLAKVLAGLTGFDEETIRGIV